MPPEMARAGHLAAQHEGTRGKRRAAARAHGHRVRTLQPGGAVEADGPRIRGQGVSDMKGGVAILLEALRALKSVGVLDGATISVLLTGDEESVGQPGARTRADLVEMAKKSDVVLSFEGMGLDASTVRSRWPPRGAARAHGCSP